MNKRESDKRYREKHREELRRKKKEYYEKNKEKILAQHREYRLGHFQEEKARKKIYQREHRGQDREYQKEYRKRKRSEISIRRKKYREKTGNADAKVSYAVKTGKLSPYPCEICGKEPAEAHHDDYNKPLDVRWLCKKHHLEWHEQNSPTYRNEI